MTPQEIKSLRHALGRSQAELAKIIGASEPSVARWETGKSRPIPSYLEKLRKLQAWVLRQGEGR